MVRDFLFRAVVLSTLLLACAFFATNKSDFCSNSAAEVVRKADAINCIEFWTNRYQGLIGAIATLVAAVVAYGAVTRQISQNERHKADSNEREAAAARAVLPLALSAIIEYAEECMRRLDNTWTDASANPPWPLYEIPNFPAAIISTLQDGVRHSDKSISKQISNLIANAQIQSSRMRDLHADLHEACTGRYRNIKIEDGLLDAAKLFVRAEVLFEYARGDYDRGGVRSHAVSKAFVLADVFPERYEYLEGRIRNLDEAEGVEAAD